MFLSTMTMWLGCMNSVNVGLHLVINWKFQLLIRNIIECLQCPWSLHLLWRESVRCWNCNFIIIISRHYYNIYRKMNMRAQPLVLMLWEENFKILNSVMCISGPEKLLKSVFIWKNNSVFSQLFEIWNSTERKKWNGENTMFRKLSVIKFVIIFWAV